MRRVAKPATGVAGIVCPIVRAHHDVQMVGHIIICLVMKNTRGHSPQQPDPALAGARPDDTELYNTPYNEKILAFKNFTIQ